MAKLSLKHIYKIYDNGTKAVDDFNLEIGDNEFIVFVGPSGCGKSTTLRMIAGLEDITAGDFLIDGVLANGLEPKQRDMAMVFQNYALYPHMSVYDNMAFGLRIRHVPKAEIEKRVQEAAKILDIADQLNKKPKEMSGGQRQRVALGRAIVRKPKVFLLDEPLSNLDAKLRSSMRSEITKLHNVLGTTFIYVTHDQVEAMTMGSRIVVMKKGVMQQVDTPMNLYDYPNNIFVAGFIGTPQMNFIDAKICFDENNDYLIKFGDCSISVPRIVFSRLDEIIIYKNVNVTLGIRPEHLILTNKENKNSFPVIVDQIEALGNEANLFVKTEDGKNKFVTRILRDDSLRIGDKVYFTFNNEKIHLFDKETTNTLLPRIPNCFTIKSTYDNGRLFLFGKEIVLPKYLCEKIGNDKQELLISITRNAIIKGNDFSLPIIKKENINNQDVITVSSGSSVFTIAGSGNDNFMFSLDFSKISIINLGICGINTKNVIKGKLTPTKREMTILNKTMITSSEAELKLSVNKEAGKKLKIKKKNVKVFTYSLLGREFIPSESSIIKIYSLLGKKFMLHDISFVLDADNIKILNNNEGIKGTIKEVIDYDIVRYAIVDVEGNDIVIKLDGNKYDNGQAISLLVDCEDFGIIDDNFGVKMI